MCVYSMVVDHYTDKWDRWTRPSPTTPSVYPYIPPPPPISPEEIEDFRRLLERAKKYDKDHNEPDCELESKKKKLLDLAKKLGVGIDFL